VYSFIGIVNILNKLNIYINEVPIYGKKGIDISQQNKTKIDTSLTVQLSVENNKIEVSVTNTNGIESLRKLVYIQNKNQNKKEEMWFVGLAVNNYHQIEKKLNFATKDIVDLNNIFKQKCEINNIEYHSILLLDEDVTKQKIISIKDSLKLSNIDDKIIVAFSGHGLLNDKLDYYLGTVNTNFEKPEENGLPYEELENLLDNIPARKKLLLIDACQSGEVDKEEVKKIQEYSFSSVKGTKGSVPLPSVPKLGLKNSFELMRELFVNIS
jgi:hypothetical protein